MQEALVASLSSWENFYVIIGSSAAALTGLMFVVITLTAGVLQRQRANEGIAAFSTPTVVHFGVALLIAAGLSAPWQALWHVSVLIGLTGLWGVGYVIIVLRRTRRQTGYKPVFEDWLWHVILPLVSYATLLIAAIVLLSNANLALFGVGAAAALMLFIGIHNAWDTVTYLAIEYFQQQDQGQG